VFLLDEVQFLARGDVMRRRARGLLQQITAGYRDLENLEERAELIPHRTRYLRLLNELARRTLDTQRDWLEHVEQQFGRPHK
jgi:hypothetical protein